MGFTRRRCLMQTEYIAKDTFDKTVSDLRQQIANLTSRVSAIGGGVPAWNRAYGGIQIKNVNWVAPENGYLIATYLVPIARERRSNAWILVNGILAAQMGLGPSDLNGNLLATATLPMRKGDWAIGQMDDQNNYFQTIFVPMA